MKVIPISRDSIVQTYGEDSIISKLLNLSLYDINQCLADKSYKVKNPLRVDNNPSLGMRIGNKGKIYLFDFVYSIYRGDIFDFAGIIFGLNPSIGREFKFILIKIHKVMSKDLEVINELNRNIQKVKQTTSTELTFLEREYNALDITYWLRYITIAELKRKNVYPIIWGKVNNVILPHTSRNLTYAYVFGTYNDIQHIEFYTPHGDKAKKFRTNFQKLKIPPDLKVSKRLILIKSYKDLIMLDKIVTEFKLDYAIIALPSENYILTTKDVNALKKNYNEIFLFTDYDKQGVMSMFTHNILYDIEPLCFVDPDKIIDFLDVELKGIVNKIELNNGVCTINDIFEFIMILNEIGLKSIHKDVYDNLKSDIKNKTVIAEYLK